MKILVCEPGRHPYVKDIEHTLENLQHEADGYIQAIYPFEDQAAVICNEEGLFRDDLAWNRIYSMRKMPLMEQNGGKVRPDQGNILCLRSGLQ